MPKRAGYARRLRNETDRRQVIVELTPQLAERAAQIWGPIAEEASHNMARMSVEQLTLVIGFFDPGRELNERHVERIPNLECDS